MAEKEFTIEVYQVIGKVTKKIIAENEEEASKIAVYEARQGVLPVEKVDNYYITFNEKNGSAFFFPGE